MTCRANGILETLTNRNNKIKLGIKRFLGQKQSQIGYSTNGKFCKRKLSDM